MGIESGGQNLGMNSSGALGLMQVTPSNWQDTADQFGGNLSDPWTNIRTAAEILSQAYKKYGNWNDAAHSYLGWGPSDANGTTGAQYVSQFNNNLAALGYNQIGQSTETGSPRTDQAINAAKGMLGKPYVWGGESLSEGGFDCSGLVQYAFSTAGVALPRTAAEQYAATQHIAISDAKAGDLLFFQFPPDMVNPEQGNLINHVAIYLGNGMMLQASTNGGDVHIRPIDDFYRQYFVSAGRVPMGGDLTMNHTGVDAPAPPGSKINAVQYGHVLGVGEHPDLGHYVVTFDGHHLFTYGHLARGMAEVKPGDYVRKDEIIGRVGRNGLETGPHVHLDVHDLDGNPVDPFQFI
jgi:cell wall-associated NlpC family hydrolase